MRRLVRQERGAVVIELALIAPVLALMVVGVVDISNAYNQKLTLEQGAQRAIEKMQQTSQNATVTDSLKNEVVCQVNGSYVDDEDVEQCSDGLITADDVTVIDTLECIDEDGTVHDDLPATSNCTEDQTETRYRSVAVTSVYEPMFPVHFSGYSSSDGGYRINVSAGVRTK